MTDMSTVSAVSEDGVITFRYSGVAMALIGSRIVGVRTSVIEHDGIGGDRLGWTVSLSVLTVGTTEWLQLWISGGDGPVTDEVRAQVEAIRDTFAHAALPT